MIMVSPALPGDADFYLYLLKRVGFLGGAFFGPKKELIMLFWSILGHVWCSVVTLVTFSNFDKIQKMTKYFQNLKFSKNPKIPNKIEKLKKSKISTKKPKKYRNALKDPTFKKCHNCQRIKKSKKNLTLKI